MSILNNSLLLGADAGAAGYQISRSLRFDSAYLSRTPASAGNRKTWTWSGWVKRSRLGVRQALFAGHTGGAGNYNTIEFITGDSIVFFFNGTGSGPTTTALFRDLGAWMHVCVALDTTQATASDRVKIYVNGALQAIASGTYPAQNADLQINAASQHDIGVDGGYDWFNGYLADIHFIDGQALTPSSFAEANVTTGQWVPKAYTGTYGTNGFRLDFSDNSAATATTLGKDAAGSSDWTPNNFSVLTGSAVPIASATGGQPIHNTTDTFGATIGTGVRADANASTLVLAAPLTTAGSNNLSDDESPTGRTSSIKTLTANGSITSSTSVSRYYGGAALFSSTGYYALSGSDFTFGTGNFTIEAWVYNPSGSEGSLFATHPNSLAATTFNSRFYGSSPRIDIYTSGGGEYMSITGIPVDQWIHIAMCRSGGTTMRLFINGTLRGTSNGWGMSLSDTEFFINAGRDVRIGNRYYQDVRVYKGLAKYSSDFAVPNAAPNPTLGAGNDSLVDTPTSYGTDTGAGGEVRGNYATLNPLSNSTGRYTLSDGNLKIAATDAFNAYVSGTIALPASGKFYFEYTCTNTSTSQLRDAVGFVQNNLAQTYLGNSGTLAYEGYVGTVVGVATGNYSTWGNNDVIGIAVDCSTGKVWFSKNNTWQNSGSPTGGTGQVATLTNITNWIPACGAYAGSQFNYTVNGYINFGQRPFAYTAPSGFKALCDTNLPAPVVAKPNTVMDVVLWSGDGTSNRSITLPGGFSPDFVWTKMRNAANQHLLYDAVRGATLALATDNTNAETTRSTTITSFDSSGFTTGSSADTNGSGNTYVAWAWDAGSSTVTNTQGSITSQVRANPSAGFSIVTYTGTGANASVGHGCGTAPSMIIVKSRNNTWNWVVYHASVGNASVLALNTTAAAATYAAFANTTPTSTVFSLTGGADRNGVNVSAETHVAYCFAPVAGYSSFGSYTGNGSTDGPFVFTGFRPRWILIKNIGEATNWWLWDTARNTRNFMDAVLYPDLSSAEFTDSSVFGLDALSNGFKMRNSNTFVNGSAKTYIYAAFAENPFQFARAR